MCNMPVHGKIHGDEGVMGETVWRTRMTNAKKSVLYCHGPSLVLVVLSLFSLGLLWGISLSPLKMISPKSAPRSIVEPISPRERLSWNDETQTKRAVYERSNAIIGDLRHTN